VKKIIKKILLGFFYYSGLWLLFRYFNRHKIVILMYHGVTERDINCWTQLAREEFENQIEFIGKRYRSISMTEAAGILRGDNRPIKYGAAVTFDDGFQNNLSVAYPILKKYSVPAIIFLTTSFMDKEPRFAGFLWTDYILALFRGTELKGIDLSDLNLGRYDLGSMEKRHQAKEKICGTLKRVDFDEKNRIIGIIASRLRNRILEEDRQIFQSLDWNNISELSKKGLIDFGAHTVNHEILRYLPIELARKEMEESKKIIGQNIGREVSFFAYPNGTRADFDNGIRNIAAENFNGAVTTIEGLNAVGDNMYELKRVNIGNDLSMMEFKLRVSGTLDFIGKFMPGKHQAY